MNKESEKKALGIIAIVLGSFALIMSFFVKTGGFAFLLGIVSLIFGIIALIINRQNKLLLSLIGTIISLLAIFISLIIISVHNASLANAKENESSVSSSSSDDDYDFSDDESDDDDSSASSITSSNEDVPVGESTTLGAGTWTVGKDIKPGIYVLTTAAGSGNITSDYSDIDDINIILSSSIEDADSEVTNYRAILSKGQEIKIEGLQNVNFQVDNPLGNAGTEKYISGQYIIGVDIKPGRYQIDADLGSGNIMTDDGEVNEILSTDPDENSISSTTVDLTKGQVLSTDLNRIQLTQK